MPAVRSERARRGAGGRPPRSSRQAVVEAGLEILKDDGLTAVTLSAVGDRLGLDKVALYTYVASKDDLLLAMRDEVNRRQLEALQHDEGLAPEAALKASCARLVDIVTHYGQLILAVEPDLTGPGLEVSERFFDILARLDLNPQQQLQVYVLLASVVHTLVARPLPGGLGDRADDARVVAAIAREDGDAFPHLRRLFEQALMPADGARTQLVEDVLSLVIDVLIPTIRAGGPGGA